MQKSDMKFLLTVTGKLLLICAITAVLLAGVNALTAEKIADNIRAEKAAAIQAIFPEATANEEVSHSLEGIGSVNRVLSGDNLIGCAINVVPLGFGGELDIMVGINADGSIAGIEIISHSETPGLGSRASEKSYLDRYTGLSGELLLNVDVDAITGVTVSSTAVLNGVNDALDAYAELFAENGGAQ